MMQWNHRDVNIPRSEAELDCKSRDGDVFERFNAPFCPSIELEGDDHNGSAVGKEMERTWKAGRDLCGESREPSSAQQGDLGPATAVLTY